MALASQLIDVPFRGGLAQGVAPELVPAGGWLQLENAVLSKDGEIRKRPGFNRDTQSATYGAILGLGVHPARDELIMATVDDSRHPSGYSTSDGVVLRARPEAGGWQDRGLLPPFGVRQRALVRSHLDLDQSSIQLAVTGRFRVAVWLSPPTILGVGAPLEVWMRVDEADSGHAVIQPRRISIPPSLFGSDRPDRCTVFVSGSHFVVVWGSDQSGAYVIRHWKIATDLNSEDAVPTTIRSYPAARALEWDACPLDAPSGVARWVYAITNGSAQIEVLTVVTATGVDTPGAVITPPSTPSAPAIHARSMGGAPTRVIVGCIFAGLPHVTMLDATAWNMISNAALESTGSWNRIVVYLESNGSHAIVAYSGDRAVGKEETVYYQLPYTTPPTVPLPTWSAGFSRIPGQEIWSRPFEPYGDGRIFFVVTSYLGTDKRQAGYHLIDTALRGLGNAEPPICLGSLARYGGKGQPPLLPVWVPSALGDPRMHLPVLVTSDEVANGQLDEVILDGDTTRAQLYGRASAQGLTLHTGSRTTVYDGQRVLPAGFPEPPVIKSALVSYQPAPGLEGTATGANVYLYTAVYAYRDDAGNTHYSEPAPIKAVSIGTSGGHLTATVTLEVQYTALGPGAQDNGGTGRTPNKVYVLLFRTVKNQSAPFYQRIASQEIDNRPRDYSATFVDTLDDSGLAALGYGFLYTDGGILPAQPAPPSCGATVHGGRFWLIDAADRRRVWFSRTLVPGEAPAWNEELTIRLDDADEITAIESLDASLAVFTRSRVYLIDGDGPNDQGEGGAFAVRLLTTTSGCVDPRSVLRFEGGILYRDASGLQLLARGGLPVPVGDPVRDVLDQHPGHWSAWHDAANRRCLWALEGTDPVTLDASGKIVVFDYRHTSWSTWSVAPELERWRYLAGAWGVLHVTDDRRVLSQSTDGYDNDGSGNTWITLRVRTPWIRLASLAGYQRARKMFLQGEKLSDCTLHAQLYLDHDGSTVQDAWSWDLGPGTTVTGLPNFAVRAVLARQHGRSVAVEIYDAAPTATDLEETTGVRLFGLSLEIGAKPGALWLAAGNKR